MPTPEIHLTKKDFDVDWFSGTGGGGQHRNKHMNCCRITHIATGLRATGQSYRERPRNQEEAFEKLARLVIAHYTTASPSHRVTETIRTYHEPRNEIIDHASGARFQFTKFFDPRRWGEVIQSRSDAVTTR